MVPRAAAHVFVDDLERPVLDQFDAHHLVRVLRLRPGEVVTASDGAGRWRGCRFDGAAELEPEGVVMSDGPLEPIITIGFTPVKAERPEWTVQKLTELGVDRIVPLRAERSVVRWDGERAARQLERWRRVAREAAMQSRRAWLPALSDFSDLSELAGPAGGPQRAGVALAEPGGEPLSLRYPTVLVGPEGGWTPGELAGRRCVGLGPAVLRAETAALAAAVLLGNLRIGTIKMPS